MTAKTILVLGGTGKTGRRVAAQLTERGHTARVASRGAPTRFDWNDDTTWPAAVRGADGVYVVPDDAGPLSHFESFISLATQEGVRRLVLLSAREGIETSNPAVISREDTVRGSGVEWTLLRPVWFAQNFSEEPFLAEGVREGEVRYGTEDGRHPFIDAEDIAAVAVAALTEDGHAGRVYTMSGPRALSIPEALDTIAAATGRTIRSVPLPLDEYERHLTDRYYPAGAARAVTGLSELVRRHADDHLSDGVREALGREPRDFADYVATTAEAGGWG
ncbi:NAD(P)H-binding protein [Actinoalloteichus caeruleus]|uniref:NAD(P)H-binding protein n=1 Tax=Actinoalloteichus cyanogriseus TaxID=2893586 RepID=UPI0004AA413B|nr:NAD(P)H-binding protein [Actinoalloteichus caeruleus]